ncbi:MAG: DUF1877 family protein [Mycolicibacterium vanbaalenii]|uniref:DUF1877 family protein n=1 Tax=Mycolicibacterium vanbaalenii TaxID=110539 RepID=UPI0035675FC0
MGPVTSLVRATRDQLDHLTAHPDNINEFLLHDERRAPPSGYLDKSVDIIQTALDASAVNVTSSPATFPGEPIATERGRTVFAIYPDKIRTIADAVAGLSREEIGSRLHKSQRDYVMHYYDNLIRFLEHAAAHDYGVLISHG